MDQAPAWTSAVFALAPTGSQVWNLIQNWIRASCQVTPVLTPLENDVWTADKILQSLRRKRSLPKPEEPVQREKRFISVLLPWMLTELLRGHSNTTEEATTMDVSEETLIESSEVPEPPTPVETSTMETNLTSETTTEDANMTTTTNPVGYMMAWLQKPLYNNRTLLSGVETTQRPEDAHPFTTEETEDLSLEKLDPPKTDYSYDYYVLFLLFVCVVMGIAAALALNLHADYLKVLRERYSTPRPIIPVHQVENISMWTIDSDLRSDNLSCTDSGITNV